MADSPAICLSRLTYAYPKQTSPALQDVDLQVERGEVLAVMGPTGAGKTTLACTLNGLIPHFHEGNLSGEVRVGDLSTAGRAIPELVERVGLVLQDPETQVFGMTVLEDAAFGPANFGLPRAQVLARSHEALARVRLAGYEDRLTAQLSGGEKQRLAIAGVLAMQPEVLVVDEPTSELDPAGRAEVLAALRSLQAQQRATVVLVTHEAEDVIALAAQVCVLADGKIAWIGTPSQLFRDVPKTRALSLRPLQVAELGHWLWSRGLLAADDIPVTLEQAETAVRSLMGHSRPRCCRPSPAAIPHPTSGPDAILDSGAGSGKIRPPLIEIRDLEHRYAGGTQALAGITLSVGEGEFVAIIGQNGAGKSTLVKHLNGLLKPTSGSVTVCGLDTRAAGVNSLAQHVGYVFQNPDHQIFCNSVAEEIRYGLKNLRLSETEQAQRVAEALSFVGLEQVRDRHPFTLGKGERQKVAVASILAVAPPVIVIDEPTTGLDWAGTLQMMALIQDLHRRGHTIIMITHNMQIAASYAERVILMGEGRVVRDGPPGSVFADVAALRECCAEPLPMTLLAQRLKDLGCPRNMLRVDQMADWIMDGMV